MLGGERRGSRSLERTGRGRGCARWRALDGVRPRGPHRASRRGGAVAAVERGRLGHGLRKPTPSAPVAAANRVSYRHRDLSEWYRNGPLGLEQGFTVARRLPRSAGRLTIQCAPRAGWSGAGWPGRRRSRAVTAEVRCALRRLERDRRDRRALPARLGLAGTRLLLRVDDSHARYPLTIDPFVQQGSKQTASDETGRAVFGLNVALSADGNTALIGGSGDNWHVGAAWVFTGSGSTWTQQGSTTAHGRDRQAAGSGASAGAVGRRQHRHDRRRDRQRVLLGPGDNGGVGAAWVFTRSGSTLDPAGREADRPATRPAQRFGFSVALSADGNTALIGGRRRQPAVGAAWVFTRSGGDLDPAGLEADRQRRDRREAVRVQRGAVGRRQHRSDRRPRDNTRRARRGCSRARARRGPSRARS